MPSKRTETWRAALAAVALASGMGGVGALSAGCGGDEKPKDEGPKSDGCATGVICTWAGTGEPAFNMDGLDRLDSALYWPMDVEVAPDGRVYVLDWQNHRVRRVDAQRRFETVVGTDEIGDGPFPDAASERTAPGVPGNTINLNHPTDVVFTADGNMVLSAWHNHKIRHWDAATGMVDVTCGAGPGYMPPGDGVPAATALMNQPKGAVVDPATGDVYVVDTRNLRIRKIAADAAHTITTVAGTGARGAAGDGGPPLMATFSFQKATDNPEPGGGIAMDAQGRLYVVDTENQRIRRVDLAAGLVETVAGNGTFGFSGDGGPATDAQLNYPRDAEIGADGRIYIADTDNHRVRVVDLATGIITTLAGTGSADFGGDGGPPAAAALKRPFGIGVGPAGEVYVADTFNNRIRKVTP